MNNLTVNNLTVNKTIEAEGLDKVLIKVKRSVPGEFGQEGSGIGINYPEMGGINIIGEKGVIVQAPEMLLNALADPEVIGDSSSSSILLQSGNIDAGKAVITGGNGVDIISTTGKINLTGDTINLGYTNLLGSKPAISLIIAGDDNHQRIGFFGATPTKQPLLKKTADAEDIVNALAKLGLIKITNT